MPRELTIEFLGSQPGHRAVVVGRNGIAVSLSSTAAFRADMTGRELGFGVSDERWLLVASLLEQATTIGAKRSHQLVRAASRLSRGALAARPSKRPDADCAIEVAEPFNAVVLLAEQAENAGALNIAASMLDTIHSRHDWLNDLDHGRILVTRARIAGKMGHLEDAADRYRFAESLGRRLKSDELRIRTLIGRLSLAQMRGNYPEMARLAAQARRASQRAGLPQLERVAITGLIVAAGVARRWGDALLYGWAAYRLSAGSPRDEAEILQDLGQVLLDSGHATEARAAFAAVLTRPLPVNFLLPALGGLALAGALTNQAETTRRVAREALRLASVDAIPRYAVAYTLLEVATGLRLIGELRKAERLSKVALELAEKHGFHEVVIRAEALAKSFQRGSSEPQPHFNERAEAVVKQIAAMEPKRFPARVGAVVASAKARN